MPRHLHIRTVLAGAVLAAALLSTACGGNRPVVTGSAVVVLHTTAGDMRLELDGRTPRHRDNFLELAREGFFDSLLFHRVIAGFMIQSGDPDSRRAPSGQPLGLADAGYELPAEIVYPALAHTPGALAAARTPDDVNPERKSSGSQFYIVWGKPMDDGELDRAQERVRAGTNGRVTIPDSLRACYAMLGGTPHLDGQYAAFGKVVAGMDVVDQIAAVRTDWNDKPTTPVKMKTVELIEG